MTATSPTLCGYFAMGKENFKMNLLFTVCGRAGSKGVKGKNVRDFCGVPLVWYTFAAIDLYQEQYAAADDRIQIVLNTDSEELIRLTAELPNAPFVIRREAALSGDTVPKVSVIRDCLERSEVHFDISFDMVVDLDITSPLRTAEDVRNAIEKKRAREETDVVLSVTHARRNPYFNMVKEEGAFFVKAIPSAFTTRQQAPVFYDENASIYAYSPRALREKEAATFFNDRADAFLMEDTGILDIDSEEDYYLMQAIAAHLYETHPEMAAIQTRARQWRTL